jgi:hypothetical protein
MSLLLTSKKYIFISIPKNASHAVHGMLGLAQQKEFSSPADAGILDNHASIMVIRNRYGESEFSSRFKFSFVRNPWDRCVSWYAYHKIMPPYLYLSFSEWVRAGLPTHWDGQEQNGTLYNPPETSPLYQSAFLCDKSGNLAMDFVGRIENFTEDANKICAELGIQPLAPRTRNRSRRRKDYSLYYTAETRAIISELLDEDIRMFGYKY